MPQDSFSTLFKAVLFSVSLIALLLAQKYLPPGALSDFLSSIKQEKVHSQMPVSSMSPTDSSSTISTTLTIPTMASISTMRAIVMHGPGSPSVLRLSSVPKPTAKAGQVLIRIKSFGINRSEMFTRQGLSPGISFPRILGIEAAGVVESAPDSKRLRAGDVVVTAMGGMGRVFDGGYAEYTVVPAGQVLKIAVPAAEQVDWTVLGALPELFQTAWGSVERALALRSGDKFLVRGATSSVGLAAIALAKQKGAFVVGTTRNSSREALLKSVGADEVLIDTDNSVAEQVKSWYPVGFEKILELVGVTTLDDSLKCAAEGGTVCMTGISGGKWAYDNFTPMMSIPTAVKLTTYAGTADALLKTPIHDIYSKIKAGRMKLPIKTFKMEDIVAAHELMEFSGAEAKVVVLVD